MTEQKRSLNPLTLVLLLSGVFFAIFLAISGVMYLAKTPSSGVGGRASLFGGNGAVGVVEINGVILDSKKTLARLEKLEENERVKAVVLRLNSPGGAVAPSQEIYEAVRKYKKPLVISMGSVAASGAFYVACGAKKVFANAGTMTGSIGVIMEFANLEKLYEWAKIQRYVVKTGKFKDVGAEYRQMTPEEKAIMQTMVDDVLLQFKKAVAEGRHLSMEQVTAVADGRIFSGSQAKSLHLVDELGTLRDAIQAAAQLAGIQGKPSVIYMEKPKRGWLDLVLEDPTTSEGADSEWRSGRLVAYFLKWLQKMNDNPVSDVLESSGFPELKNLSPGLYWILQ